MTLTKDFLPPANWRKLFDKLVQYRATLLAPVDTVGCHCLYDRNASSETRRFQILVALMLSSQTKDHITAEAMNKLMQYDLTPQSVLNMPFERLNTCIQKVGFHNTKAKYIKQVSEILMREYDGNVPKTCEELIALPGVGPKMAHLFLQSADQKVLGIGVDTHVHRISRRFCWTPEDCKTPEETRKVLESWLPRDLWDQVNKLLVGLGQTVCRAVNPCCSECLLNNTCPNAFLEIRGGKRQKNAAIMEKRISDIEDQLPITEPISKTIVQRAIKKSNVSITTRTKKSQLKKP